MVAYFQWFFLLPTNCNVLLYADMSDWSYVLSECKQFVSSTNIDGCDIDTYPKENNS